MAISKVTLIILPPVFLSCNKDHKGGSQAKPEVHPCPNPMSGVKLEQQLENKIPEQCKCEAGTF